MEWLHDEISMDGDGLDREQVYELFEKAVKDYICECLGPPDCCVMSCCQGRRQESRT